MWKMYPIRNCHQSRELLESVRLKLLTSLRYSSFPDAFDNISTSHNWLQSHNNRLFSASAHVVFPVNENFSIYIYFYIRIFPTISKCLRSAYFNLY